MMSVKNAKKLTILGTILLFLFLYYLISTGCLTDPLKMENLIDSFGLFSPILFLLIQIIQVIIPIIPGGVSSGIGVILFGPIMGLF